MRRGLLTAAVPAALFGMLVALTPGPAAAATFTVTTTGDGGDASPGNGVCAAAGGTCTLRAAVDEANALAGADTITLPATTIVLGSQLELRSEIDVVGAGAASTIIDGSGRRVFMVRGGDVELRGLTIRGGDALWGGGVFIDGTSRVEINEARIADNGATTGGGALATQPGSIVRVRRTTIESNDVVGAFGGGIANFGLMFLRESLVALNDSNRSGGIYNASSGILVVINTTVSGNNAHSPDAGTGGLINLGFTYLNNATVTDNKGRGSSTGSFLGGGLRTSPGGTTVVKNSIIAGNDGRGGPNDCSGPLTADSRYVLIGDATGCGLPSSTTTFRLGVSAGLGPLANNGGPTRTHLPSSTSPAVNAGFPFPPGGPAADSCAATDQRGVARLVCDLGAVEREVTVPLALNVNTTADEVDATPGDGTCRTAGGVCSLRAAVQEANRLPGAQQINVPAGTYVLTIPPGDEGGIDPAAGGDLDLREEVTVVGVDPATVIVDGGDRSRIFDVSPLATGIVIRGMTIRNGTDLSGGGVRVTTGALTLDRVIVEDNDSNAAGGGISAGGLDSRLVIQDSIIRNNRAPFFSGDGGGIDASGELTVERTSITGNRATGAGGGLRATGNVVVRRSTISGNTASGSVLANGGGISASGLRLEESTVSGNTSASQGGGVFASGTLINSTISGNTSSTSGGGVSTSGTLSLLHVTVASNSATVGGGGLHRFGSTSSLTVRNTLLANSGTECAGLAPTSLGNNLSRDASCGLTATGDRSSTGAALNGLADNGGPTRTHLPMAGSPAINGAASAGLTTDQRGQPRPRGVRPDIGAVERE